MSQHDWKPGDRLRRLHNGRVPAMRTGSVHTISYVDWDLGWVQCEQGFAHAMEGIEPFVDAPRAVEPLTVAKAHIPALHPERREVMTRFGKRGPDDGSRERMMTYAEPY